MDRAGDEPGPSGVWGQVSPSAILKRQDGQQRDIHRIERTLKARQTELVRLGELQEARWKSYMDHEHANLERRIVALETTSAFWTNDDNVQGEITRLGLVRLSTEERQVFAEDIAGKVLEKQVEERDKRALERREDKTRRTDAPWLRFFGLAAGAWIVYQFVFGAMPLTTLLQHVVHLLHIH